MTPGFFGKVRSHGDFVSRRLPPEMQVPFDAWIQAWLVQSKLELGADWLPIWSRSPLWRFVLAPGVCGPQAWTGVMMPSADRVGRCFPLILATGLRAAPILRDCLTRHACWFDHVEELALSSLGQTFSIASLDGALQALEGAPQAGVAASGDWVEGKFVTTPLPGDGKFPPAGVALARCSAWWTNGFAGFPSCMALGWGLPPAAMCGALIDGRWRLRGWRADYSLVN